MASMLHAAQVIKDFGLVSNPDKVEGPSQRMEFLGLILDSIKQTSSVSDSRMVEVKALLVSAQATLIELVTTTTSSTPPQNMFVAFFDVHLF